jgi:carbonic anhydrase
VSSTDGFVANAARYAAAFDKGDLPTSPACHAAVVACMDARLNPYGLLGLTEGDAHIIRNAGGVVTEDVIRSLTISQRLLGTSEIVLIHHTDCGMLAFRDDDIKAQIEADTGVRPPFALEAFPDLDADVLQSIARIKASPFIPRKDSVRGFVYEVATGCLREVNSGLSWPGDGRSGSGRSGPGCLVPVGAAAAPDHHGLWALRQVRWRLAFGRGAGPPAGRPRGGRARGALGDLPAEAARDPTAAAG